MITGRIESWLYMDNCMHGRLYNDFKNRWDDDTHFRTSFVVTRSPYKEGDVVQTLNSSYKLGKPFGIGNV